MPLLSTIIQIAAASSPNSPNPVLYALDVNGVVWCLEKDGLWTEIPFRTVSETVVVGERISNDGA